MFVQGDLRAVQGKGRYITRPAFGPDFTAVHNKRASTQMSGLVAC